MDALLRMQTKDRAHSTLCKLAGFSVFIASILPLIGIVKFVAAILFALYFVVLIIVALFTLGFLFASDQFRAMFQVNVEDVTAVFETIEGKLAPAQYWIIGISAATVIVALCISIKRKDAFERRRHVGSMITALVFLALSLVASILLMQGGVV